MHLIEYRIIMKRKVFIDFEYTGIDNELSRNNEVIAMYLLEEWKPLIAKIYSSDKENTVGSFLVNGITKEMQEWQPKYNSKDILTALWVDTVYQLAKDFVFYWYGIKTDKEKAFIGLDLFFSDLEYIDVQELFHSNKKTAEQLIIHWDSLNVVSKLYLDKVPSHTTWEEVIIIKELFELITSDEYKKEQTKFYIYVPYGFAKWLKIEDFVEENRRTADGIRYNNDDLYSRTLDHYCELYDYDLYN